METTEKKGPRFLPMYSEASTEVDGQNGLWNNLLFHLDIKQAIKKGPLVV